jgi:hypothetical protein
MYKMGPGPRNIKPDGRISRISAYCEGAFHQGYAAEDAV